ncbi:hypothetical protein C6W10_16020 [Plantactinospora sp. BB1]|nr:hypothetical protein C6W10_16020 [Plantactinospora sp. BB1]
MPRAGTAPAGVRGVGQAQDGDVGGLAGGEGRTGARGGEVGGRGQDQGAHAADDDHVVVPGCGQQAGADTHDHGAADEDVGFLPVAQQRIAGDHGAAGQQQRAPLRVT